MATRNRDYLKDRFKSGDIPGQDDFSDLIESSLNQSDNIRKDDRNSPLKLGVGTDSLKRLIEFYNENISDTAEWSIRIETFSQLKPVKINNNKLTFFDLDSAILSLERNYSPAIFGDAIKRTVKVIGNLEIKYKEKGDSLVTFDLSNGLIPAIFSSLPFIITLKDYYETMPAITTDRFIQVAGVDLPNADFAELFESHDKSIIPVGTSVLITESGKIRYAEIGETPIGVIASTAALKLGSYREWPSKYTKNEFGQTLTEEVEIEVNTPDGKTEIAKRLKPILNPSYDPTREYIPRSQRPEWHPVGLLGQLHLRKGQPVAPTWVKIKDVSENVELWLVK